MPTVSIITPFLNAEQHLAASIDSVLGQIYRDWELVLIDDGSTDASAHIAERYAAEHSDRIRLLPPDPSRRGAATARNRGIAVARGGLVACLDADDLYLPGKLANDLKALEADPSVGWVYGATRWFFENGAGRDWTERPGVPADRTYPPPTLLIRVLLRDRGDVPCTCGVLMRRELVERLGGFEERFPLYEDQALWAKLLLACSVRVRSGVDALYRQHPGSTSQAGTQRGEYDQKRPHPARLTFLTWLRAYCVDHAAPSEVIAALDRSLAECAGGFLMNLSRTARRLTRYVPVLP